MRINMQVCHYDSIDFIHINTAVRLFRNRRLWFKQNPIWIALVKRILALLIVVEKMTTERTEERLEKLCQIWSSPQSI